MNRMMMLAAAATVVGVGGVRTFFVDPPVDLQATTPGTQQTGNINVSGTVRAGTFFGSSGGTTTKVVSGWATSPTGFVFGGDFRSASSDGRGIFCSATATAGPNYGGDFRSASSDGRGIFAYATSTSGKGIGGEMRTDSANGTGLIVKATGTTGTSVGATFDSYSPINGSCAGIFRNNTAGGTATALKALITASTDPFSRAIYADGLSGYGMYASSRGPGGIGLSATGDFEGIVGYAINDRGVRGTTESASSYGVYGQAPVGGSGNAVFANGTLAASGTKTMRIDHPDDPENKYLLQYCAEGDSPQLYYRGVVKLDGSGRATVQLPHYFDQINRDPSYQLTAIGAPMPSLYVAQEETNNQFSIAGGKPGARVSWLVIGIRNDRFVQQYGAKTEVDKPAEFRGTYLRPELYNKRKEQEEGYDVRNELGKTATQSQPQTANSNRK